MPRMVALLRGINLAGRRRVAMADLRALLEDLGYADVRTHLQSGNAVLTTGDLNMTVGTLDGSGTVKVTGTGGAWSGGTMAGAGTNLPGVTAGQSAGQ